MSRSYRKPWCTDGYRGSPKRQFFKRCSNKLSRKEVDLPEGMAYKRNGYTYDICDYKFYEGGTEWEKKASRK